MSEIFSLRFIGLSARILFKIKMKKMYSSIAVWSFKNSIINTFMLETSYLT